MDGVNSELRSPTLPAADSFADDYASKLGAVESLAAAAYMITIGSFSLALNGYSLATIVCKKERLKPSEYVVANINAADMCLVVSTFPFAVSSHLAGRWLFGRTGCVAYAFLSYVFGLMDLMAITVAAIARFTIICHSATAKKYLTKFTMLFAIFTAFAYSLFWAALPLGGWGSYGVEPFGTECSIDWNDPGNFSYLLTITITLYFGPATVLVYCYCRISRHVAASARALQQTAAHCDGRTARRRSWIACALPPSLSQASSMCAPSPMYHTPKYTYASKVGTFLCVSFFVCWTPYAVTSVWTPIFGLPPIPASYAILPAMIAKTSVLCNPVLYLLMDRGFVRKLSCLRPRQQPPLPRWQHGGSSSSSSTGATATTTVTSTGAQPIVIMAHVGGCCAFDEFVPTVRVGKGD